MKEEKIIEQLENFIEESYFYDNEYPDFKIINADCLLDFIKCLKDNYLKKKGRKYL